jgi:hypothetical protein
MSSSTLSASSLMMLPHDDTTSEPMAPGVATVKAYADWFNVKRRINAVGSKPLYPIAPSMNAYTVKPYQLVFAVRKSMRLDVNYGLSRGPAIVSTLNGMGTAVPQKRGDINKPLKQIEVEVQRRKLQNSLHCVGVAKNAVADNKQSPNLAVIISGLTSIHKGANAANFFAGDIIGWDLPDITPRGAIRDAEGGSVWVSNVVLFDRVYLADKAKYFQDLHVNQMATVKEYFTDIENAGGNGYFRTADDEYECAARIDRSRIIQGVPWLAAVVSDADLRKSLTKVLTAANGTTAPESTAATGVLTEFLSAYIKKMGLFDSTLDPEVWESIVTSQISPDKVQSAAFKAGWNAMTHKAFKDAAHVAFSQGIGATFNMYQYMDSRRLGVVTENSPASDSNVRCILGKIA